MKRDFKYDCIIVGSGPLGAISAKRLSEHGMKVLILEAGEAISLPPASHLRNQSKYRLDPDSFFDEIFKHCQFYDQNAPRDGLPGACKTEAFGGQGLLWTNNCPRPTPYLDTWNVFDREKWMLRLSQAESYLHVRTDLFKGSLKQKKIKETLTEFLNKEFKGRVITELPLSSKQDAHGNLHYIAPSDIIGADPNIKVECHTKVIQFLTKNDSVHSLKAVTKDQKIKIYKTPTLIIAAGAFDSARLLYDSQIRPAALGKYLHYHPLILAQIVLKKNLCSTNKNDPPPRLYIPPTSDYPWHAMILRDIFPSKNAEDIESNQLIDMQFFAPIEVRQDNQMIFETSPQRFHVTLTKNDELLLKKMRAEVVTLARKLGRFRRGCEPNFAPFGLAHPMGTTRMGIDPKTSVSNQRGRVHGFKNLYIASVGLIPLSFSINPTLTAAALAIETAEAILKK